MGRVHQRLSENVRRICRLGILTYKQKTAFSKGQFNMYSTQFQFSLWNCVPLQKTVPLYYALFFLPRNHPYLCFSLAIFLPCTPRLPHFHCYQPDHCLETYMHWSITYEDDFFWLKQDFPKGLTQGLYFILQSVTEKLKYFPVHSD